MAATTTIRVFNTGFNVQYWNRCSLETFLSETLASGFFKEYTFDQRKQLLTQVYNLIIEAP